jgi:BMFP domain-containing protein YqiC
MADRPRFFDDLAGVAGGAISALTGLREEAEAIVRARIDETIRALDLVRRDEYDAAMEMAARARDGQEAAAARVVALEERLAVIEARLAGLESAPKRAE